MYKILIVDDEKKEREGIRLLIKRYKFDLHISLAQNGEEALKMMEKKHYDILLTDIKMPHMDGIQLLKEIQKRKMNPVCIIHSAYGEFEYAKSAISLGVLEYLLKPVKMEAFVELFEKVINFCKTKEDVSREKVEVLQTKEDSLQQKTAWRILNYLENIEFNDERDMKEISAVFNISEDIICIPIIISCYSNLFSVEWEKYQTEIKQQFGKNAIIINNMDNQIIILLSHKKKEYIFSRIKKQCECLIEKSKQDYNVELFVVLGKEAESSSKLKREYTELKEQLDYQFFTTQSMLIVHEETYFLKKENDMMGLYVERIMNCAKTYDYYGIDVELEKAFAYTAEQTGFSSVYVKYTFTDIIKQVSEYTRSTANIYPYIDQIYQSKTMDEVENIIHKALICMKQTRSDIVKENRLVRMAKDIVYEKYGNNDLNVSLIAEELHVSTAYLSSLYKNETGKNLVKFITNFRMEKSKELLKQSNMKISDVAESVGYLNVSYYISIFRNQEGCSPVQYRERQQANESF